MNATTAVEEVTADLVQSLLEIEALGCDLPPAIVLYGVDEGLRRRVATELARALAECSKFRTVGICADEEATHAIQDRYCVDLNYFFQGNRCVTD